MSRVFEYDKIVSRIKKMEEITGAKGDKNDDTIAGILSNINQQMHDRMEKQDELTAVYGDLGNQLLLDWDNTSSNFDKFVDNFDNWSMVVTKAANDYSDFETRVKGIRDSDNYLGMTSNGRTTAYTNDSFYSYFDSETLDELKANISPLLELTGATYLDIDISESEKSRKFWSIVGLGLDAIAILSSGAQIVRSVNALRSAAQVTGSFRTAFGALRSASTSLSDAEAAVSNGTTVLHEAMGALEEARSAGASVGEIAELERSVNTATRALTQAQANLKYVQSLSSAVTATTGLTSAMTLEEATEQATRAAENYANLYGQLESAQSLAVETGNWVGYTDLLKEVDDAKYAMDLADAAVDTIKNGGTVLNPNLINNALELEEATEQLNRAQQTYQTAKAIAEQVADEVYDASSDFYHDFAYLEQCNRDLATAEETLNSASSAVNLLQSGGDLVSEGNALTRFANVLRNVSANADYAATCGESVRSNMVTASLTSHIADAVDFANRAATPVVNFAQSPAGINTEILAANGINLSQSFEN